MAYLPETKDKTPSISPAAQRVLGPEDPRAREEVEARRNQEFGTMDQIGMAADMLPGGAIAAGGAKAAAKKGPDIYKMINDALKGFQRDGDRGAQSAIVNWVSSTDTSIITKAQEYLDSLSDEALKSVEPVRKALSNAYNQFISPKGGHTTQWKDPSTPSAPPKPGSALEYVQQQKKIGKDIEASKATTDIMATKDLPSATRMKAGDMPSPSGKGRLDQKMVEGLKDEVETLKSFSDEDLIEMADEATDLLSSQGVSPEDISWYKRLIEDEIKRRGL